MLETERKKNEKKQNKVRTIHLCLAVSLACCALKAGHDPED